MGIMQIEARKKLDLDSVDFHKLDDLDCKTVSLGSTVQYLDFLPEIKKYLEGRGKIVIIKRGAFHKAHVLGCNPIAFDRGADILLLLADGKFHALNNAAALKRDIYVFNLKTIERVTKRDIEKIMARMIAKKKRFLTSDRIGVLFSTKRGQRYKNPHHIIHEIKKLGKQVYCFEADNIDLGELENFPIQIWINTACPGLGLEDPRVVNLCDIKELL